ncbi:ATP-binding protein [Kribbella sp. WER1]
MDARNVCDLATFEFVRAKSNVVLLAPPGVGKTILAVALAIGVCPGRILDLLHHPGQPPPASRGRGLLPVQPASCRLEVGHLPAQPSGGHHGVPARLPPLLTRLDDHHRH